MEDYASLGDKEGDLTEFFAMLKLEEWADEAALLGKVAIRRDWF